LGLEVREKVSNSSRTCPCVAAGVMKRVICQKGGRGEE
jgi:hypothetical protein